MSIIYPCHFYRWYRANAITKTEETDYGKIYCFLSYIKNVHLRLQIYTGNAKISLP